MTVLVAIVAVFLAYNANAGLPFVPTYDVKAQLPGGSNLVEAQRGAHRRLPRRRRRPDPPRRRPARPPRRRPGPRRPLGRGHRHEARQGLRADRARHADPDPAALGARPQVRRAACRAGRRPSCRPGGTIPLAQSLKPVELDDFFSTFDEDFRANQRTVLEGYGNALAGRGQVINLAIQDLVPFLRKLEPVMRTLSDDAHRAQQLLPPGRPHVGPDRAGRRHLRRPVREHGHHVRGAVGHRDALRQTIERLAPDARGGHPQLPGPAPVPARPAELARRLEPVADQIEESLPVTGAALRTGTPVLTKAPPLYRRTREVFRSLDELAANPNTLLALRDLHSTVQVTTPLVEHVAPYQTVCNYWNYYWTAIAEHVSEEVPRRHHPARQPEVRQPHPGQPAVRLDRRTSPVDVPRARTRHRPRAHRRPVAGAAPARLPAGDRRAGQRRLPGRPARLPARTAHHRQPLRAERGRRPRRACSTATCPGCRAARTSRASSGIDNLKDVP